MKVGYLITARLKSTRLRRKVLLEVNGKPFMSHMIHRIRKASSVDEIVICTSTNPQDDPLEELAGNEGIECFRGEEEDVIKRLSDACDVMGLDYALNITADCPLVDPEYAELIIESFQKTGADLIRTFGLPHGAFSYGLKPSALKRIVDIKDDIHTEVWGKYFTDTDLFTVQDLPVKEKHYWPDLRMTLDYPEDYEFFKALWSGMSTPPQDASLDEIISFLRNHPEIVEINRNCAASFRKRFNKQSVISLKKRYEVKRAVVIGAGSIGQRHIRNMGELGIEETGVLRTRQGHTQELPSDLKTEELKSLEEVEKFDADVAIISNPTALHVQTASDIVPFVKGVFIEKPLSDNLTGVSDLLESTIKNRTVTFMGYNLQYHPIAVAVSEMLQNDELGRPISVQATAGHWLPDWHPYEDFRESYAARRDLGGGVGLTLIHEIQLIMSWLGDVTRVISLFPDSELLPLDVDVQADYMLEHVQGCVSQIHLDFIQKSYHREGIISCERGAMRYDFAAGKLEAQTESDESFRTVWNNPDYDTNTGYKDMLETFINYVKEGRIIHEMDIFSGVGSLAVIEAGKRSAENGCWAEVEKVAVGKQGGNL